MENPNATVAFNPHVYEIHGNTQYMHCANDDKDLECIKKFYDAPSLGDFERHFKEHGTTLVPKCEECGTMMKCHSMCFDESYNEHFYRTDTVKKFADGADCLLCIGTHLETGQA
jgi:NAD-dependent deacetylase